MVRVFLSILLLLKKVRKINGSTSPETLINVAMECPAIKPDQVYSEFIELVRLVKDLRCQSMLEIGTYRGGTLFVFAQASLEGAAVISIDYTATLKGRLVRIAQTPVFKRFLRKAQNLTLLRADSHHPATLAKVSKALHGKKLDFLFIDGDHSYTGVKQDFEMYAPLVRPGGLVAFHDVALSPPPKEVYRFWDEVKRRYPNKEFIHRTDNRAMGIGVLFV